jgi:hypothetical protein
MRRALAVICLLVLTTGVAAAWTPKALVRLSGLSDQEMKAFLGSDFDLAATGPDFVEVVLTHDELAMMKKAGKKVRELIPDLDAYVARRLAEQTPPPPT